MIIIHGSDDHRYTIESKLGGGGQGHVHQVSSNTDGQPYAMKWYHPSTATDRQRGLLEELIRRGAPVSGVDGIDFIWPLEIISHSSRAGFGYVMPLIDTRQFVNLNCIINGRHQQPTWQKLCRLSYLVCMALESVHRKGMAYCDINLGNIMFDTVAGRLVVCDNDNVMVNNADGTICGVPEFMAPEVALEKNRPNALSDLYSVAILLYQLWMWEHPMDGRLTLGKVNCWDLPAKKKRFAEEPLFVHHPKDDRNSAEGMPMLNLTVRRWQACPPILQQAFTLVFTEGVRYPDRRVRLSDWQRLFLELEASAMACSACSASNLIDITATTRTCFHCGQNLPAFLLLTMQYPGGSSHLVVHTGAELRRHHLEINAPMARARDVVGVVVPHPKKANVHGLRNSTQDTWYCDQDGQRLTVEPEKARPLLPNGRWIIGQCRIDVDRLPGVKG